LFGRLNNNNKKRSKNNKSPKLCLGDLIIIRNGAKTIQTKFGGLIVFAPFLIIRSPKQRLETYCFCSVSYYYFYYYYSYSFFPQSMNLSTADLRNYRTEFHETWWSYRYMIIIIIIIIIIRNGAKTISLQTTLGRLNYYNTKTKQ
jgi:hypothetical protein